jgi:hypothetical protein
MKAKNVPGYIVVNYGVTRGAGQSTEYKNGKLRIKADYNDPKTHRKIMDRIHAKHPGWGVNGYAPAKPLAAKPRPSVDAAASGKSLAGTTEVKYFWAVMKASQWSALTVAGYPMRGHLLTAHPASSPCSIPANRQSSGAMAMLRMWRR